MFTPMSISYYLTLQQCYCYYHVKHPQCKGKVNPRRGHEGPEVEQRYSSTLSLTLALDGGGWTMPRPGHFTPGKDPLPTV